MKTITLTPQELLERGVLALVGNPPVQPESALAHKYLDGLKGIEIGPAAYQPFGLDSIAIATGDPADRELYRGIEVVVCGRYVEMDHFAEANDLPVSNNSQGFVLSSHVLEHTPNPIACFVEWNRVVRHGGYIYIIVPKRENPYGDEGRMITPIQYFYRAYEQGWTDETAPDLAPDKSSQPRNRGHIWVFNLWSLIHLVKCCETFPGFNWQLIEAHETDDKDRQGHMVIYRVNKENKNDS